MDANGPEVGTDKNSKGPRGFRNLGCIPKGWRKIFQ